MPQVAIVGAGPLGGELAFLLARRDAAETIVIVDEQGSVAAGKALDIMQSSALEAFATRLTGSTDPFSACGTPIVVVADRAAAGEWQGEEGLMLLRRLMRDAEVVVCAGAEQRELVQLAVRELKMDRRRVLGSAPEALASSVRAIVAAEADRSPGDVGLAVLGVPPRHVVIPWEDATVGGLAATRLLDEPARRRIAARASHLWPPGPMTLAAAAAKAVMAVLGQSREQVCAFVAADDTMGMKRRAGAMPVLLGPAGVERIDEPTLSVHDRVALDNALML